MQYKAESINEPIKEQLQDFLTLPDEQILLIKRKHVFMLLVPLCITGVITLLLFVFSLFFFLSFIHSWMILTVWLGIVFAASFLIIGKNIIEWNFHWYIITNRKILEVCYVPLSTYFVNDISLDQVKCTEIDIHADGVLNELLDMGDINITFDRPTHEEGFTLHNIRSARRLGMFLTNHLLRQGSPSKSTDAKQKKFSWYKEQPLSKWRFTEEVFPKSSPT